jgi:hypothetical protein
MQRVWRERKSKLPTQIDARLAKKEQQSISWLSDGQKRSRHTLAGIGEGGVG